jgi:hypothetical protein
MGHGEDDKGKAQTGVSRDSEAKIVARPLLFF